jgi:hypothetical protein
MRVLLVLWLDAFVQEDTLYLLFLILDENGKGEIHVISKASRFLEGGLTGLAWIRMAAAGHQTILNNVQD